MDYPRFRQLNGRHPFRDAVPGGYVAYRARRRPGTEVAWLNFDLAREMGLIAAGHPNRLTAGLRRALRDSFGLTIVNEHDLMHGRTPSGRQQLPGLYMATRYLQLQHPDRRGTTSGDGRSIWNGTLRHGGISWDVSSCGTGVTRLCPATALEGRFFATGSEDASYGCGTASLEEGLETALMSEIFHAHGLATERVLCILTDRDGFAIVVRAAPNLIRPSHFLAHLKQGSYERLRAVADLFLARQRDNGVIGRLPAGGERYRLLADDTARTFGRVAAVFESEYIFCWLDWDGDNILADGGIIDYGSVRQFGLCHREYRFDDGPRFSTTLTEQRRMARLIVQNFAQIRDFLITGRKRPLKAYRQDAALGLFDRTFHRTLRERLLYRVGLTAGQAARLLDREPAVVEAFRRAHSWFERARSARGPQPVPDGISWNAVYSSRDLLRELPCRLRDGDRPTALGILEMAWSSYADEDDRQPTPHRLQMARRLRRSYMDLLRAAARVSARQPPRLLAQVAARSALINRAVRITGDSITHAARMLLEARPTMSPATWHRVIARFIADQVLDPDRRRQAPAVRGHRPEAGPAGVLAALARLAADFRHSL